MYIFNSSSYSLIFIVLPVSVSGNSAICIKEDKKEEKKMCWKFAFVVCISLHSLSRSFHITVER